MQTPSGGRFPVFLVAAMFETLRDEYGIAWQVDVQGINAADAASGLGGDIVIADAATKAVLLAVEVTLRAIEQSRVEVTFVQKIAPGAIADYLFLHGKAPPTGDARQMAFSYFAQGHDISFLQVDTWLINCLGAVGSKGRERFIALFLDRFAPVDVPVKLKLKWNDLVSNLAGSSALA